MATTTTTSPTIRGSSSSRATSTGTTPLETNDLQLLHQHLNEQYQHNNQNDDNDMRITSYSSSPLLFNNHSVAFGSSPSLRSLPIPIQSFQQHQRQNGNMNKSTYHDEYATSDDDQYSMSSTSSSGSDNETVERSDIGDVETDNRNGSYNHHHHHCHGKSTHISSRSLPTKLLLRAPYLGSRRVPTSPASSFGLSSSRGDDSTPTISNNNNNIYQDEEETYNYDVNHHDVNGLTQQNQKNTNHHKTKSYQSNLLPPPLESFLLNTDKSNNNNTYSTTNAFSYDGRSSSMRMKKISYGSLNESNLHHRGWDNRNNNNNYNNNNNNNIPNSYYDRQPPFHDQEIQHEKQRELNAVDESANEVKNISFTDEQRNHHPPISSSLSTLFLHDQSSQLQQDVSHHNDTLPYIKQEPILIENERTNHNKADYDDKNHESSSPPELLLSSALFQGKVLEKSAAVMTTDTSYRNYNDNRIFENNNNAASREKQIIDYNMISALSTSVSRRTMTAAPISTSYGGGNMMNNGARSMTTGLDILKSLHRNPTTPKVSVIPTAITNGTNSSSIYAAQQDIIDQNNQTLLLSRSYHQQRNDLFRNNNYNINHFSTNAVPQQQPIGNLSVAMANSGTIVNDGFAGNSHPINAQNPDTEFAFELDL